jgi:hypothetical protein
MAGFEAVAAVGDSIVRLLNHAFETVPPVATGSTRAALFRTDDLVEGQRPNLIGANGLSVLLYRVDFDKAMRASWSGAATQDGRAHLALDLHYLFTAWSSSAAFEHAILGRTMQALEDTPVLAGPLLAGAGGFAPQEALQLMLEDISTEALMRTFDSLPVDYRLSVPYVVRVLRIDGQRIGPDPTVRRAIAGLMPEVA